MTNPSDVVVAGTRRAWSRDEKRAILAEAEDPATTALAVARRHGLHSSLLFRWRRAALAERRVLEFGRNWPDGARAMTGTRP